MPFDINDSPAFYIVNQEIELKLKQIQELNDELNNSCEILLNKDKEQLLYAIFNEALVNEIISTNAIENIYLDRKDITIAIAKHSDKDIKYGGFISMYQSLMDKDYRIMEAMNCEKIREYYDHLFLNEIIDQPDGTLFRKDSVGVYNGAQKCIHQGVNGEDNIVLLMDKLLNFMKQDELPDLVKIAIFHYYFSYIHPFYDGNGRLNRYLTSLFLSDYLNKFICLNLASTLKELQKDYYRIFDDTNNFFNKGDLTIFITKFLDFILQAVKKAKAELNNSTIDCKK